MLTRTLSYFTDWLGNVPQQRMGIRVLQIALGAVFIFRAFTELPFATYLYGRDGIGDNLESELAAGNLVATVLTSFFQMDFAVHLLLLVLAACGVCYIFDFKSRIVTFVSLITFNMISSRNIALGDGGDNITQIILIYMLFLIPLNESFKEGSLKVWFHNLGVVATGAQIMILYFTAGFMKISGDVWTSGIALFYVSQVEAFSLPLVRDIFKDPYVSTFATYITMIFLVWFPIAMFSKLKLLWIFIGIAFHIGILGFMGLVTFGVTMIGLELFFLTDSEYRKIAAFVKENANILELYRTWKAHRGRVSIQEGFAAKEQV